MIHKYTLIKDIPWYKKISLRIYNINNGNEFFIDDERSENLLEWDPNLNIITDELLLTIINWWYFNEYFADRSEYYTIFDIDKELSSNDIEILYDNVKDILYQLDFNMYNTNYVFFIDIYVKFVANVEIRKVLENTKFNNNYPIVLKYIMYKLIKNNNVETYKVYNYKSLYDFIINTDNKYMLINSLNNNK